MRTCAALAGLLVLLTAGADARGLAAAPEAPPGAGDGSRVVWTLRVPGGADRPRAALFSESLDRLALWKPGGGVAVWDSVGGDTPLVAWQGPAVGRLPVPPLDHRMAFLDGDRRLVVFAGGELRVCETGTGEVRRKIPVGDVLWEAVSASRDGRMLATLGMRFWDGGDGSEISRLAPKAGGLPWNGPLKRGPRASAGLPVSRQTSRIFAVDPAGERLLLGLEWGEAAVWNLRTDRLERVLSTRKYGALPAPSSCVASAVAFLPDGGAAVVYDHGEVMLFPGVGSGNPLDEVVLVPEVRAGRDRFEIHSMAVSGDGRRLALGGIRVGSRPAVFDRGVDVFDLPGGAEVQVWDLVSRTRRQVISGPAGHVAGVVCLDREGRRLGLVSGPGFTDFLTPAAQKSAGPGGLLVEIRELVGDPGR